MKNTLYRAYYVAASHETELRRRIKGILNSTPPNTTTLNRKAALMGSPRHYSNTVEQLMLVHTGLELKTDNALGEPNKLFIEFRQADDCKYYYKRYYIATDWLDAMEKVQDLYDNGVTFEERVDDEADDTETNVTEDTEVEQMEQLEATDNGTDDTPVSTVEDTKENEVLVENKTDDELAAVNDYVEVDTTENNDACISKDTLMDALDNLPKETDLSSYISNIMKTCDAKSYLPPISVFYACIKSNGIIIDANIFRRIISRMVFLEWSDWLFTQITTTKELTHSGKFLIDTGFIKIDNQPLYIIVDVDKNYPRYIKLDCSLVDIKAAKLDKSEARNQRMTWADTIKANPLSMDNIDFGTNIWKQHILVARQYRFGLYQNLDYDTRMNMIISSIEHACLLEARGIDIKRIVRGGTTNVSVAIPLRYKNNNMTNIGIILTLNRHNVWEIATIESDRELTDNIKTYNFYNMPSWLRETN